MYHSYREWLKLKAYFEYLEWERGRRQEGQPEIRVKAGDKVHLLKRQGMFTVEAISLNRVTITCHVWQSKFKGGQRDTDREVINLNEIKCKAGGLHNVKF